LPRPPRGGYLRARSARRAGHAPPPHRDPVVRRSAAAVRILIVMMSAVGDAVHVLPVVTALKRHDSSIRISWVLQPVLAGGRSEREVATEGAISRRAEHPIDSTLGVPFRELLGILGGLALTISLDTGPMHISVALGTPTIALMGYNNPKRVGPYRRFGDLVVDAYGDPGEEYPISIQKRPGRTRRITVEQVLEKVELWQRAYRR
jgi:ADP-heptose:LPS heptosyltransferase